MPFILNSGHFKRVYDNGKGIIVELDYSDSNNKFVNYIHNNLKESFIIVDNRNLSCEIYLTVNASQEIINNLKKALPVLGFASNKIFFV